MRTHRFQSCIISGKVSRDFAELEPGNLKIVAGSSRRRNCPNKNEPATARVPLGGPCPCFPRRPRKAFMLSSRGLLRLRLETSQQAGAQTVSEIRNLGRGRAQAQTCRATQADAASKLSRVEKGGFMAIIRFTLLPPFMSLQKCHLHETFLNAPV